ncbi:MAG: NAD-dependent epimerase/dehydratase family protein [Bacteroidota bacterium]
MNLVTGATGILGSHVLLELLKNGQPVVACKQNSSDLRRVEKLFAYYVPNHQELFAKIKWVDVDVRDIFSIDDALEGITTVYHCAGLVSFDKRDRQKLTEINEVGTANVVNACLGKKIQALCHVSSIGAINNSDYILPLHEDVFWKTSGRESHYAISKYNGEREVWRGIEEGLNAVIVNPGVILSPGFRNQSSSRIFDTCYRGNKFYTSGSTGYVAAADVAKIMVALITERKYRNRYILVEGNYKFRDVFSQIHTQFKNPAPRVNVPRAALVMAGFFESIISFFRGKPPRINKALINAAFNNQVFSNKKIRETLNYSFIPIDQTIGQICKSYLFEISSGPSSS